MRARRKSVAGIWISFSSANRDLARCDVAVISDTSQYAPGIPAITYGLRGTTGCEMEVVGPNQDLHSGVFGGSIANPANALARLIGGLHDDQGRVTIPGFYDDVVELTDDERRRMADLPFDEVAYLAELGVSADVWRKRLHNAGTPLGTTNV